MSVLSAEDLRAAPQQAVAAPQTGPALEALPRVRRRHKGLAAGVILLLAAALGVVLALNIQMAGTQYTLVQMQNEHRDLVHQNEALTQQVQYRQSPQQLSSAAVSLGMSMPAAAGTFSLGTGEVLTEADAAEAGDRPSSRVASAALEGSPLTEAADVAEHAGGAPSGLLGAGALETLNHAPSSENGSDDDAGADQRPTEGLNGGSIPAPTLND